MNAEINLVTELAIILIAAGVFTLLSKALKQPLILGYIVAGFLVGPKLGLFPQFSAESIHEWSEIGIIFLLFGLGLEFSFKKLIRIGSSAFITSGVKCVGMFAIGMLTGSIMGWTPMESLFLGGMLGMSSTTIIIKAYEDMGLKDKPYSTLIFGSLVFEDLIAVLLLVLLSTIAVTGKFEGGKMLFAIGKLVFFIILCFLIGIYVIPLFLKKAKKYLSDEILMLVGIGLCFSMVVIANLVGFSSALGAFVMGSILAETLEGEKILKLTGNIKDLFGAIFFVSVGMMVDPAVIAQYWLPIIIITIMTMLGILLFSTIGVLLAGQGLDTAVHAGFSLAQLGEFAFIIAGLGCSLDVMRDFIYPVIIAVSVITTFTTPYMIKLGDPVSVWLHRVLPAKVIANLNPKRKNLTVDSKAEQNVWKKLLKSYFLNLVLFSVIVIAVIIGDRMFLKDFLPGIMPSISSGIVNAIDCLITMGVSLPFLYLLGNSNTEMKHYGELLVKKNPWNRWLLTFLIVLREAVAVNFIAYIIISHVRLSAVIIILFIVFVVAFIWLTRRSMGKFANLRETFLENLNEKEMEKRRASPVTYQVNDIFARYDIKICRIQITQNFAFIGKTLREMPFRRTTGVNIIKIVRGTHSVTIPSGAEPVYPGDVLLAVGTEEQLVKFREVIDENMPAMVPQEEPEFGIDSMEIGEDNAIFLGKSLRDINMRASGCMVVSVMRDGEIIANPHAEFTFREHDIIWIAGEKDSVSWYCK